jgi:peptide chain release factor 1
LTDHRIGLTLYSLTEVLNGQIKKILDELRLAENAQRMKEGTGE